MHTYIHACIHTVLSPLPARFRESNTLAGTVFIDRFADTYQPFGVPNNMAMVYAIGPCGDQVCMHVYVPNNIAMVYAIGPCGDQVCMHVYECMYVCMYVSTYVRMYVIYLWFML